MDKKQKIESLLREIDEFKIIVRKKREELKKLRIVPGKMSLIKERKKLREQLVLSLHREGKNTYKEIGKKLGISMSRAAEIGRRAERNERFEQFKEEKESKNVS
jgi:hypothetical protein